MQIPRKIHHHGRELAVQASNCVKFDGKHRASDTGTRYGSTHVWTVRQGLVNVVVSSISEIAYDSCKVEHFQEQSRHVGTFVDDVPAFG